MIIFYKVCNFVTNFPNFVYHHPMLNNQKPKIKKNEKENDKFRGKR